MSEKTAALVVGDWFVDENWVCGVHRSSSSSRTGKAHYRALHHQTSTVQAFCGAGRSASFLMQVKEGDRHVFDRIVGLGFWHKDDTETLRAMFNPHSPPRTPYRLTVPEGIAPDDIELLNMNDALHDDELPGNRAVIEYTTRIIRTYRQVQDRVWWERLDWEPPLPERIDWGDKLNILTEKLKSRLESHAVQVVVIKDLLKGAIDPSIISWLADGPGKDATWYVSSKKWRPDWLGHLERVRVRLLLVPQVAAQEAVRRKYLSCWITRSGRVSDQAIGFLERLYKDTGRSAELIIVLPEEFSAMAWQPKAPQHYDPERPDCFIQPDTKAEGIKVPMGGASIFFPAMISSLQCRNTATLPTEHIIGRALKATYDWVQGEGDRVLDPDHWQPDPRDWKGDRTFLNLLTSDPTERCELGVVKKYSWKQEDDEWKQALRELGVVKTDSKKKQLQLWRSMVEVDGYVCCDLKKRKSLRELVQGINAFVRSGSEHTSCTLVAPAGSGKTYLGRRLARSCGLRFLPFNITQMRSRVDIFDCFDTIVASQEENREERLLVFVDEINAPLESSKVYSAFLGALEEGSYMRGGKTFHIAPCVWIFAGTEDPKADDPKNPLPTHQSDKGSDFVSRLTLGVVDLKVDDSRKRFRSKGVTALRDLEKVYLGVSLLRQEYPDVQHISESALRAFRGLPPSARVRDVKHFVKRFVDIQYGRVMSYNVPDQWPQDEGEKFYKKWRDTVDVAIRKEEANVEIVDE